MWDIDGHCRVEEGKERDRMRAKKCQSVEETRARLARTTSILALAVPFIVAVYQDLDDS
ncbi:hypothetical protein K431DRAFT_288452, partial [Polychaeton citri CBS 116435]